MQIPNNVVIILNGTSSSGKSSIAKQIQTQLAQPLIHAQVDHFLDIFNFEAFKTGAESLEAVKTGFSLFENSLQQICRTEYPILIDTVFERPEYFDGTVKAVQDRKTYLIGIHCPVSELNIREKNRGNRRIGLASEQFSLVHENKDYDFEIDSSLFSPCECASQILLFIKNKVGAS